MYINGELVARQPFSGIFPDKETRVSIGSIWENGDPLSRPFLGTLAEIRIWNFARSVAEVKVNLPCVSFALISDVRIPCIPPWVVQKKGYFAIGQ